MQRKRLCIFCRISHHKQRQGFNIFRNVEGFPHGIRIKMHHPAAANANLMGSQHHVSRHNRCIHRGSQSAIIGSFPALLPVVAHKHGCRCVKMALCAAAQLGDGGVCIKNQDPLGLVIASRRRFMAGRQNPLNDILGQMLLCKVSYRDLSEISFSNSMLVPPQFLSLDYITVGSYQQVLCAADSAALIH